jgi:peptide/nickel transport system ATP-binding protein
MSLKSLNYLDMAESADRSTLLSVRNLLVKFGNDELTVPAVRDISFQIQRGETLGLVGESGSGKSVTALAIMGLLPKTANCQVSGEIWFAGETNAYSVNLREIGERGMQTYRGSQIAQIFQEPMSALNPVFSIGFQLNEAILQHKKISPQAANAEVIALLQEVQLLPSNHILRQRYLETEPADASDEGIRSYIKKVHADYLSRYPHQLSGGQLQRVSIAMAISCDPVLLIADEPTTALDVTVQAEILTLLRQLKEKRQMSMIFVSHDLAVISAVADQVAVMQNGEILELQPVREIFHNPQHPYTIGLLACRPSIDSTSVYLPTVQEFTSNVSRSVGGMTIKAHNPNSLDDREIVREIDRRKVHHADQQAPPLVTVNHLRVGFPTKNLLGSALQYHWAVNDVSFEVFKGETLGVVGESGCGKSTLAKTLLRLITPQTGELLFENQNILQMKSNVLQKLRRDMQIVFQNPLGSLNPRLSIGEAVMEPLLIHEKAKKKSEHREIAADLLIRVGIKPDGMNRYPHEFSGGQRQRICIARALTLNPRLIICDESVSALDVSVQAQVLNLLKELQAELQLTYIFISHDLSVVKFMSDRIMVMNQGKIEEIGSAEQVYNHPQRAYTRKLLAAVPKIAV